MLAVGDDPSERRPGAPDALPQTRELHDLRVVDEEVGLGALVLDVVREDGGVGGLERAKGR